MERTLAPRPRPAGRARAPGYPGLALGPPASEARSGANVRKFQFGAPARGPAGPDRTQRDPTHNGPDAPKLPDFLVFYDLLGWKFVCIGCKNVRQSGPERGGQRGPRGPLGRDPSHPTGPMTAVVIPVAITGNGNYWQLPGNYHGLKSITIRGGNDNFWKWVAFRIWG